MIYDICNNIRNEKVNSYIKPFLKDGHCMSTAKPRWY